MRGEERIEIDLESVAASSSRQRGAFAESGFGGVRVRSRSNRAALSCDAPFRWPLVVRGIGSRNLVTNKLFFFLEFSNTRASRWIGRVLEWNVVKTYFDTWLILPVVVCLSRRLSHACKVQAPICEGETANGSLNQS